MLASELISRSLRLINIPGRGATLSADDQQQAFEDLQDLLNSKAVTRQVVPGIRRHFFDLTPAKSIYTYGRGKELDTNPFDDPAPIRIEDAYIRAGSSIINNEQVTSGDFVLATGWTLGTGWTIANGKATIAAGNSGQTLSQTLALIAGTTYKIRVQAAQRASSVQLTVNQDGTPIVDQAISGTATFEFEFTFSGTASTVVFTANATSDLDLLDVSILEDGKDKQELPDAQGSDYAVDIIDQWRYNRRFTKGTGGRPYEILFSREYGQAELRFDNSAIAGDILVMDVLVNRVSVDDLSDELRLNPEAMRWLKYKLADEVAPSYGKELTRTQQRNLRDAYQDMTAGTKRKNTLRVDRALRVRPTFDINRGDP